MSSYLLLRNNKETGPFSFEEVKDMSLKTFDLLWVVGKSAAWRYPGEIPELKSFAPSLPEQNKDSSVKGLQTDDQLPDFTINKKQDSSILRSMESNNQRFISSRSVYVNLPAEKKQISIAPTGMLYDSSPGLSVRQEEDYDLSDLYKKRLAKSRRYSGKVLWISTVVLLFGAGILTGFFISDRRKFFSSDAIHPQVQVQPLQVDTKGKKDNLTEIQPGNIAFLPFVDSVKGVASSQKKSGINRVKKNAKNPIVKIDSAADHAISYSSPVSNDSLRESTMNKIHSLYDKIRTHPENYVNLLAGRYTTGIFGGISSFSITVTNNSTLQLNQVAVNIDYIQNNGKIFKTETLTINDLEPGETVTMKAPKSSRGIKIATHIHLDNLHLQDTGNSN
jgi:hypothetical protein